MSHFKAKMHHNLFPASICPSVRLLDGVWHKVDDLRVSLLVSQMKRQIFRVWKCAVHLFLWELYRFDVIIFHYSAEP